MLCSIVLSVLTVASCVFEPTTAEHIRQLIQLADDGLPAKSVDERAAVTGMQGGAIEMMCTEERITELVDELLQISECQDYLFDDTVFLDFEQESQIICDHCGSTLYTLLQCLGVSPAELNLFDVICTDNENGDKCYQLLSGEGVEEEQVVSQCEDMTCSDACRMELQDSFSQYGCCLYSLVAVNTSMTTVSDIWSACNIPEPDICAPAFNQATEPPTTTSESSTNTTPTDIDTTESPMETGVTSTEDATTTNPTDDVEEGATTTSGPQTTDNMNPGGPTVDEEDDLSPQAQKGGATRSMISASFATASLLIPVLIYIFA